jgi:uncharacterized protein (DUF2141 family)
MKAKCLLPALAAQAIRTDATPPCTSGGPLHGAIEARPRRQRKKLRALKTSMFHAAVMACAILLSSLFPSEPALAQGCPTPSFGPPSWLDARPNSYSVTVGDFNGDGKLDLVVNNAGSAGTVSVLLGNGDGTFQAPINSAAGTSSSSLVVGDFNGDGKLDLAMGANGAVTVLLGNGDGTFQAPINSDAGTDPTIKVEVMWVAAGDFNRDGKLDLVVANKGTYANNFSDSSVLVLLGNGDGTFQAAAEYGPVVNPYCVAVGDFNGDGNLDLAVPNGGAFPPQNVGGVSILLGNGDGTFQSAVIYDAGSPCGLVAVGDFNGDGKPDLALFSPPDRVLLGNGDGTFQNAIHFQAGGYYSHVAVADFNGDGKLDLAQAIGANGDSPSGTIAVLLGNGDGTFQTAVNYALGTNANPLGVAVGDFNGDGKADLAVADYPYELSSGGVAVLLNTCASTAPSLSIVSSNSTLTLSWPFPSTGFILESTPSLRPPNWQPAPESAVTNNGLLEVLVPVNPGSRYFRLHKP